MPKKLLASLAAAVGIVCAYHFWDGSVRTWSTLAIRPPSSRLRCVQDESPVWGKENACEGPVKITPAQQIIIDQPRKEMKTRLQNCSLTDDEFNTRIKLLKLGWGKIYTNDIHAAPNECRVPPQELSFDVGVRLHFGVPEQFSGSIVEFGGNDGGDLASLLENFPSNEVFSYEPIPELASKMEAHPTVVNAGSRAHVVNFGVGGKDEVLKFYEGTEIGGNDAIGSFEKGNRTAKWELPIKGLPGVLDYVERTADEAPIALSFNCEGCEYSSLASFVDSKWLGKVSYLQVSWHLASPVVRRREMRCDIEEALSRAGYELVYYSYFGWQGWALPCYRDAGTHV